jgi:hypothetical protein
VASIDVCGGELKCEFIPDFIEEFRSSVAMNTTRVQPMTRSGGSSTSRLNRTSSNATGVNDRTGSSQLLRSKSATSTFNNEIQRPSSSHSTRSSTTNTNLTSANLTRLQKVNIENSQRVRSSSTAGKVSGNNFDIDGDRNVSSKRATRNGEGVYMYIHIYIYI